MLCQGWSAGCTRHSSLIWIRRFSHRTQRLKYRGSEKTWVSLRPLCTLRLKSWTMNLLLLGRGKMGVLVEEIARARKHFIRSLDIDENLHAAALTKEKLHDIDVVIDFTTPDAAMENITGCVRSGKNIVVGTTGWYGEIPKVREMVEKAGTG